MKKTGATVHVDDQPKICRDVHTRSGGTCRGICVDGRGQDADHFRTAEQAFTMITQLARSVKASNEKFIAAKGPARIDALGVKPRGTIADSPAVPDPGGADSPLKREQPTPAAPELGGAVALVKEEQTSIPEIETGSLVSKAVAKE